MERKTNDQITNSFERTAGREFVCSALFSIMVEFSNSMTPNEINAWARIANITKDCAGKKVLITRDDGMYMFRSPPNGDWAWTTEKERAYIYDFDEDRVAAQLEEIERRYGAKWSAEVYA